MLLLSYRLKYIAKGWAYLEVKETTNLMSARPMLLGHVDEIPLKINTNSEGMELIAQVNTKHVESGIITRSCSARHENPITRDERLDSVVKDNPDHELVKVSRNDFESAIHLNFKLRKMS